MKGVLATMGRELRSYFLSPLGWVVASAFLLYQGISFQVILDYLNSPDAPPSLKLWEFVFGGTLFFWMFLLFITSVLTMRLLSEEKRSGTLEMLLTAPVTETQVVVGKFLAAITFYMAMWSPTVIYALILERYTELDWGPVAAGYVGTLGIGMLLLSVGTFASALTRNQVVAAVVSFTFLFVLFIPAFLEMLVNDPKWREAFGYMNLYQHMDEFSKGIVDSRRLLYYLSGTVLFLFLAGRAVDAAKGK